MRNKIILLTFLYVGMCSLLSAQCSCGGAAVGAVTETGLSGLLLNKNQWMADITDESRLYTSSAQAHNHSTHDHMHAKSTETIISASMLSFGLRYGINEKLTISLRQPMLHLLTNNAKRNLLGDLSVLSSFRLLERCKFSIVGIAGIEIPVGYSLVLNGELYPSSGSASWDPIAGIVFNYKLKRSFLRFTGMYKYNTTGYSEYKAGNVSVQQFVYNYALIRGGSNQQDSTQKSASNFTLDVQPLIVSEWQESQFRKQTVIGSGSYMLSAGLNILGGYSRWKVLVGITMPTYQQLYATHSKNRIIIRGALIYTL